ncbi:MAG: superoxide dismutase, Ni [Candidatus Magasanikbacteria bacterium CG_4_10_14_0_2_um_filter_41_10]|uniref:Superoxide dismutase, Ni n=1 Tax=Candidatus Magasanikbacteria bacterium CG_4_10_14_0_2_um_filter_41_10 TaxID=1974638 RepID=A0A2M7V207_9BACT|nr:MAG: superoxide dismutase, Ni [Candidatus Magasanikbacteria bacterium CG_4_10_14_0_2_um_filter_41_10]
MLSMNIFKKYYASPVYAHCDGPCGVYDPASARIAGEAVLSMTKKLLDLHTPEAGNDKATLAYYNTMTRYIQIKEEESEKCKREVLILWTDYFKPVHLEKFPDLHDLIWQTTKLCSSNKHEVSLEHASELIVNLEKIHTIFWETKGRKVDWVIAS